MKNLLVVVSAFAALSAQANVGDGEGSLRLSPNGSSQTILLSHCRGSMTLSNYSSDKALLNIAGLKDCSNIEIKANGAKVYDEKIKGAGQFTLDRGNNFVVELSSNSGKTADTVRLYVEANSSIPRANIVLNANLLSALLGTNEAALPSCGGTVRVTKTPDGSSVNVIFKGVEDCSKFDILSSNGDATNYGMKSLQSSRNGFSGSFTIPKRFIEDFRNSIKVQLRSNSGKTDEVILINFVSW